MIEFPDKKYNIIYADPPWTFSVWNKDKSDRYVGHKYDLMTVDEICNLPIRNISEDSSILFIWVTFPNLLDGMKVINAWGYTYKTCAFTWVKRKKKSEGWHFGMGYYTRANAEICLLATKGKILERISHSVPQIVDEPIAKHSEKPKIVADRIVELFGDIPRIELFARDKKDGWDSWGNEV